jgi:putative methyltransferase (TIGR04325 family)
MPTFSSIVQQWLPPVVQNLYFQAKQSRKHPLFPSYEAALAQCSQDGYENDLLMEVMSYKMSRYLDNQKRQFDPAFSHTQAFTQLAIAKLLAHYPDKKTFHILDFGGSMGGHYFDTKRLLGNNIRFKWAVVETPATAKAAQQFANDEIAFFDSLETACAHLSTIDLLHTSGTLQCVNQPYAFLERLLAIQSPFILFNRIGLNRKNRDVITIHHSKLSWNGPYGLPPNVEDRPIKYPFTFISEANFLQKLQANYTIAAQFKDDSGIFSIPSEDIIGGGFLVEKK